MPGDEYGFVGGGALKLKGVKGSKIDKHKKRKHKRPVATQQENEIGLAIAEPSASIGDGPSEDIQEDATERVTPDQSGLKPDGDGSPGTGDALTVSKSAQMSSKTPTEIRHEERRRKMLDDRLKREGTKSHKDRVEELNKYLSGLSEHHDMPRIGPG